MSFLCVPSDAKLSDNNSGKKFVKFEKKNTKTEAKIKKDNGNVNTGVIWTESAFQVRTGSEAILPTFSCTLRGTKIRCLKDSGCQPHFITNEIAEKLNLPVLDQITINVNGFNESKVYKTKIVEVELNLNGKITTLQAICVPTIRTNLKISQLGRIVREFKNKGYTLADEFLDGNSSQVSDLSFVLGTNDAATLLETQRCFGHSNRSVFSETCIGVMLMGNSMRIMENLHSLPDNYTSHNICKVSSLNISKNSSHTIVNEKSNFNKNYVDATTVDIVDNSDEVFHVNAAFVVLNERGEIDETQLVNATDEILSSQYKRTLNYDTEDVPGRDTEVNDKLVKFALDSCDRTTDGRLKLPLLWRGEVSHLLSNNFRLANCILMSNLKKLQNEPMKLKMMDEVFKDQEKAGVIDKIDNIEQFISEHPEHSFLSHMGVFKLDRETTKCRVVFLSNLSERSRSGVSLSHNQCIHAGPNLNQKITTAILQLRFGEYMLTYDLCKAFLQVALSETDSNRLLFLWFKDVFNSNYDLIAYRSLRLPFGLRCSPAMLTLAMYKILCLDSSTDDDTLRSLKLLMYSLLYVDNGAVCGDSNLIKYAYEKINSIFNPYQFKVQQLISNESSVQSEIENNAECVPDENKLLGMIWNRKTDMLSARKLELDENSNTKRLILSSIASQYDVFNLYGPCLNRARLFVHSLQCKTELSWDAVLDGSQLREWRNIVRQANAVPPIWVPRNVGNRDDPYRLITFCDASKQIYAAVVYIQNLRTNQINYLIGKNRLVNNNMQQKTIPTLELQAAHLGVELMLGVKEDLCGSGCVLPINIAELQLYTDSMITLHWISSYTQTLDKMQKRSVFVMNKLNDIERMCRSCPIKFSFVSTNNNPADCLTRCVSYKQLCKTDYITGPSFLANSSCSEFDILLPNPHANVNCETTNSSQVQTVAHRDDNESFIDVSRFSSFRRLVRVGAIALRFINNLKFRLNKKKSKNWKVYENSELYSIAKDHIIGKEQRKIYPEVYEFLESGSRKLSDMPEIVSKLNIFISDGVLRMKSKFSRFKNDSNFSFPIVLPKKCSLTDLIIMSMHKMMAHSGCYSVLSKLRRDFYIEHVFSTVKRVLKDCVHCRRFNARTIKLNQSSYKEWRVSPVNTVFGYVFVDHIGPFYLNLCCKKVKIWLLCLTCLWTRAVNLKICMDLSTKSFLNAFQMHICEYGLPTKVFSDLGSQLVAGGNIVTDFLKDVETQTFLHENGVKYEGFEHYFKGNSSLGSLVEVCVKFVKRLIFGSIRNCVLDYPQFELVLAQIKQLVNSRPIAFKEALRDDQEELPTPISPELLLMGRELVTCNVIPQIQPDPDDEWSYENYGKVSIRAEYEKMKKVRARVVKIYNEEFLGNLIYQAVDSSDRYKPVKHESVKVGDIILLQEPNMKSSHYPKAIVREVVTNCNDEVTGVIAMKGTTRETVKRHVSSIILLLSCDQSLTQSEAEVEPEDEVPTEPILRRGPQRKCKYVDKTC